MKVDSMRGGEWMVGHYGGVRGAAPFVCLLLLLAAQPAAAQGGMNPSTPLRIAWITAEVKPFSFTGGLSNVSQELPSALKTLGHEAIVITPFWHTIDPKAHNLRDTGLTFWKGTDAVKVWEGQTGGVTVYLLDNPTRFTQMRSGNYYVDDKGMDYPDNASRYDFFSRAALETIKLLDFRPDVVHSNDHHSAYVPWYMSRNSYFRGALRVFEIHNTAYQGQFPVSQIGLTGLRRSEVFDRLGPAEFWGKVNPMKLGILMADLAMTVSPTHAEEIVGWRFGNGMEDVLGDRAREGRLIGILNGLDERSWDPSTDPHIGTHYDVARLDAKSANKAELQARYFGQRGVKPGTPFVTSVTRLTEQKGIDELIHTLESLARKGRDFQYVLLGSRDATYAPRLEQLARQFSDRIAMDFQYDPAKEHRLIAGADIYFMPSRWEPSGLPQMYAMRYGTIPVVSRVGGLADSVVDFQPQARTGNGITFLAPFPRTQPGMGAAQFQHLMTRYARAREEAALEGLTRALDVFQKSPRDFRTLQVNGMAVDNSWTGRAAPAYVNAYTRVLKGLGRNRPNAPPSSVPSRGSASWIHVAARVAAEAAIRARHALGYAATSVVGRGPAVRGILDRLPLSGEVVEGERSRESRTRGR